MDPRIMDLRDQAYVEAQKRAWRVPPRSMIVMEFLGVGDPYLGGTADDRPLGVSGRIIDTGQAVMGREPVAHFPTIEAAHKAALKVPNLRAGGVLGVLPTWTEDLHLWL